MAFPRADLVRYFWYGQPRDEVLTGKRDFEQ